MSESVLRVSVVVPTYRRPDLLNRCLGALRRQSMAADHYEIIVCDDGPSEAIRAMVASHVSGTGPALRYVPVSATQGPAGARNAGWRQARAAVVAFTDDDTVPDPDWLSEGLAALTPGVAAIAGQVVMPLPNPPSDYELNESGLTTAEFVTANCMVRRDALEAVEGFDPQFTVAWREDSDLHFKLLAGGYVVRKAPSAIVVHPVRPAPFAVSIGMQKKVMFDALLYRKHPTFFRERIRAAWPWFYLVTTGMLVAALACGLTARWGAAAVLASAWLAATFYFTARRLRHTRRDVVHVAEMLVTSAVIPPLALYWRLVGLLKFRGTSP